MPGPHRLQRAHLIAYFQDLKSRALTPLTRYSRQRAVRTWLHWAALRGHLLLDPTRDLHWRHPPTTLRFVPSEAQLARLLEAPPETTWMGQRDRVLYEFLYGTGLRQAECVGLNLDHLDLPNLRLHVVRGKGGRSRTIPLRARLAERLAVYLNEIRAQLGPVASDALWLNSAGGRLAGVGFDLTLRGYTRQLGLKGFTAHSFRHAFATHLLARGAPIVAVQRLLGHARLETTAVYTQMVPTALTEELLRTHPRARRKGSAAAFHEKRPKLE